LAEVFEDDFETYSVGSFPEANWLDVGLAHPDPPNPPDPSAMIVETTGPTGSPTQALQVVPALGTTQGAYRFVSLETDYSVTCNVRVDRFCDGAPFNASDWAMDIAVGQFIPGVDLASIPQVGIYASSRNQQWRLFAYLVTQVEFDIDLGLPVELGRWYTVALDLDAVNGIAHSRISDAASGVLMVDRIDAIAGWTATDGQYDVLSLNERDASGGNIVSNVALVDDLVYGDPTVALLPATWGSVKAAFK
jgi:hypothetical protein